jgi:signal transduction histidine kinase
MADVDQRDELSWLVEEQSALRRIATLVAEGAEEADIAGAVTYEIAQLFGSQRANAMRWDGETITVLGDWGEEGLARHAGRVFSYGGDTITARIVESCAPARVDSPDDITTAFGKERWAELGLYAAIGAPIIVAGRLWGVVTASRTTPGDPFPDRAEQRLADFASLVAQAVVNLESRRELAALVQEQAALRRVATLVAGGKPQAEVLGAVMREASTIFGAHAVTVVRWEGVQDEVMILASWNDGADNQVTAGSLYHPAPGSPTLRVLETGFPQRADEPSTELGPRLAIAAPVIVNAELRAALTALRPDGSPFPAGAEIRLRSFADLVAQSIANAEAHEEMRASRARIVKAADAAREKLERNLHDGAQQRLVSVSLTLRLALTRFDSDAQDARELVTKAADELTQAIDELRELARGIHPAVLTGRGLGPALEALAARAALSVEVSADLEERLPAPVEAAAYYLVAESLTNATKYANATEVEVRVRRSNGLAHIEVVDDGIGGADPSRGSGLRGLADRVEALDGRLGIESPPASGTRVWAEIPVH